MESPSGRVTLQRAGLDFEQYTNFIVTVNSTDSGFPPYTVTDSFEISVTNVNEMPQGILLDNNQVNIVNVIKVAYSESYFSGRALSHFAAIFDL